MGWLMRMYEGERCLLVLTLIVAVVFLLAAFLACLLKDTTIYTALLFVFGGGMGIAIVCRETNPTASFLSISLLSIVGGAAYVVIYFLLWIERAVKERKKIRAEIARRIKFTLPEDENTYVRARLHTTLNLQENEFNAYMGGKNEEKADVKLSYARVLLNKVREAPLSAAERLQTEEMAKIFSLYCEKEGWTAEELRAMNDLWGALLKLSAKYAV